VRNLALVAAAGLLAYGAWRMRQDQPTPADDGEPSTWQQLEQIAVSRLQLWRAPAAYAGLIADAEARNGLPAGMLERLLYQECHYREDIITGRVRSSVGALGIAQFMPATAAEQGIDPLNPAQAIAAAGRYLAQLFARFGTWAQALAAYNWGMGNVQRKGLDLAPAETRAYYSSILLDVNQATGNHYA
jgi:soluble lytic murein transglycosylase-like protein